MAQKEDVGTEHPLSTLSDTLDKFGWRHLREGDVIQSGSGDELEYWPITFTWIEDLGLIHFVCAIELEVKEAAQPEIDKFILEVNPSFYVGHFEHRPEQGLVVFRYGLYVNEGEQWESSILLVLNTGIEACKIYGPAFKSVADGASAAAAYKKLRDEHAKKEQAQAAEQERPRRLHS